MLIIIPPTSFVYLVNVVDVMTYERVQKNSHTFRRYATAGCENAQMPCRLADWPMLENPVLMRNFSVKAVQDTGGKYKQEISPRCNSFSAATLSLRWTRFWWSDWYGNHNHDQSFITLKSSDWNAKIKKKV